MAPRPMVELLVVGADAAGLAASAVGARSGAKVALAATGAEPVEDGCVPEPANFVWRLLDLHQYELRFESPTAHVSLADSGAPVATFADPMRTGEALRARDARLEFLWPAFVEDMKRGAGGEETGGLGPDRYQSANAALDDYFSDEALKTHLVSALVAPYGLAGDEAGSAQALFSVGAFEQRRTPRLALEDALKSAAQAAGVDVLGGVLQALTRTEKLWKATMDDGREVRARSVVASSALLGEAAGLRIACGRSPLLRRGGAEAVVRIRYDRRPKLDPKDQGAVWHVADSRRDIIRARNSMVEGRIDENMPLTFEVRGKEVLARVAFAPARLFDNGEWRDWTGQDRQILGRQAAAQVAKKVGASAPPREIEVTIGPDVASGLKRRSFATPEIAAPAPSPDPVGAAVSLVMEMLRRD